MSTIDQRIKIAITVGGLVFAAGGFWAMTSRDTAAISERVVDVAADLEDHEDLPSHPVGSAKLEVLVTEQRALRDDVAELSRSVASICAATSADCR